MKLLLIVNDGEDTVTGQGETFSTSALNLIKEMENMFGGEAFSPELFTALGKIEGTPEREVSHCDFSIPEESFKLRLID